MQIVVVLAHPNVDSFNHAVATRACDTLRAGGHHVDLLDLYALGFRAAMSADEHRGYHGDQPLVDPMAAEHAALVKTCDALVFVYPTWWSGLPAILKGWLERVMVPGVAFRFNAKGQVRPALTHVRQMVGISTYGSPRPYVRLVNDNGRRTLQRTLRINTGLFTSRTWLGMYAADTATAKDRAAFLDRVEQKLSAL
jgi:putative NADPH-quinone reductase